MNRKIKRTIISPILGRTEAQLDAEFAICAKYRPDFLELACPAEPSIYRKVLDFSRSIGAGLVVTWKSSMAPTGDQLAQLHQADLIDIDISLSFLVGHILDAAECAGSPFNAGWIFSYHDFNPGIDLGYLGGLALKAAAAAENYGLEEFYLKFALTPAGEKDLANFFDFVRHQSEIVKIIAVPMGADFSSARKNAWKFGSHAEYAYLAKPNAPGQVAISEVRG